MSAAPQSAPRGARPRQHRPERLVFYCRTTSASTAPRTPRGTYCPYAYLLLAPTTLPGHEYNPDHDKKVYCFSTMMSHHCSRTPSPLPRKSLGQSSLWRRYPISGILLLVNCGRIREICEYHPPLLQANFRGYAARGRVTFKRKLLEVQRKSSLLLLSIELSDAKVYEPYIRALLGTASHRGTAREFFIDSQLVWIHFITQIIQRTSLAPWEFEFHLPRGTSLRSP